MAIGDNYSYNNNTDSNKKQFKEQEIYSVYNVGNENGVDPSALSYSFWNGCLKVSISPILSNPSEKRKWDHKNAAVVYLNHTAARVLKEEVTKVLNGTTENGGCKIGSKEKVSLLTFSNGKEVGCPGYCLIIRSVDSDGTILGTYVYQFKDSYYYGVTNFDAASSKFDKTKYKDIEIHQFLDMLEQYYLAMTKATAYSITSELKYDFSRINTKLGLIGESMGVEFKGQDNKGGSGGTSYFDQEDSNTESPSKNKGVRQTTLDDLDGTMNPPED